MRHELRKHGIETNHRQFCAPHSVGGFYHFLETAERYDGDVLYVDPTWQCTLPKGMSPAQRPDVLIAPSNRILEIVMAHGIEEKWHRVWAESQVDTSWEPSEHKSWWRWQPWLARLFEDDPYHPPLVLSGG